MRVLGWTIGIVAALVAVLWLTTAVGWTHYRFWAPKYEEVRREVFVNTPSYVLGKRQFLTRLRYEWQSSDDPNHKSSICALARHEATTIDPEHLTPDLRAWECVQ